jgi:hypothetical protein
MKDEKNKDQKNKEEPKKENSEKDKKVKKEEKLVSNYISSYLNFLIIVRRRFRIQKKYR